jgi:RecQ-mediated genome instability protein 1
MAEATLSAIRTHLTSKNLPPNEQWLNSFKPSIKPNAPLVANQRSAESRLLHSDFTQSLQKPARFCFPAGIASPEVKELQIPGPVPVQILDIEDIGRSRWSQVEAIEMEERGEMRKGQEVVRVLPDDENNTDMNPPVTQASRDAQAGPHKLLLQDAKGNNAYAFEMENIKGVGVAMPMGAKLLLRNVVVARGVILLTAATVEVLGGKIEAWEKKWREDRKKVLKDRAGWKEGMGIGMGAV